MNLGNLEIPIKCNEIIELSKEYYQEFYLEMVRYSSENLPEILDKYIALLTKLVKDSDHSNQIKAAIGIHALFNFGYDDFGLLSRLFDRIIPQTNDVYVKFTSWVAGKLVHHPGIEQSRYISHLFLRLVDWTRAKGRRARPFAAAFLLKTLSINAGSNVVLFFPTLQSIIWEMVSNNNVKVLKATASAIYSYTTAILQYGRADLKEYMDFFYNLCIKLLSFNEPITQYASLLLFQQLILCYPDYFVSNFKILFSCVYDAFYQCNVKDNSKLNSQSFAVQCASYSVLASLSTVDSKQFLDMCDEGIVSEAIPIIHYFPKEIAESLCILIETLPEFMLKYLDELKTVVCMLDNDSAFLLLTSMVETFGDSILPIEDSLNNFMKSLLNSKLTKYFKKFILTVSNNQKFIEYVQDPITYRLVSELKTNSLGSSQESRSLELPERSFSYDITDETSILTNSLEIAISIIGETQNIFFTKPNEIFQYLKCRLSDKNSEIRQYVPKALMNINQSSQIISLHDLLILLFQRAIYEASNIVRYQILSVINDNCDRILASAEFVKYFQIFVNDDSSKVKNITFSILEKISSLNPISVSCITRSSLLNAFFIMHHVQNIRTRARIAKTLPYLIKASNKTIKSYTEEIMAIAKDAFLLHSSKFENFIEVRAYYTFYIGILKTINLIAPIDPYKVAKDADILIPFLCNLLNSDTNRTLILTILELLLTLLSAPASTIFYRAQSPQILASCSKFLASTHSRKARIAILKVIGVTGVLEYHQKPHIKGCKTPENIDDNLARQFFHPARDSESEIFDFSLLLQKNTINQYYVIISASSLLDIFHNNDMQEYYYDSFSALVEILQEPKIYMLRYFDSCVARLMNILKSASIDDYKFYMSRLSKLILGSSVNIAPFAQEIVNFVNSNFCNDLAPCFLKLIHSLIFVLRDGFIPYASGIICLLISCLDSCKSTNEKTSHEVLKVFSILGIFANDLLYLIIPQICDAIECKQTLIKVRIDAIEALDSLTQKIDIFQFIGLILRSALFGILFNDIKTSDSAKHLFLTLIKTQGPTFIEDARSGIQVMQENYIDTKEFEKILNDVINGIDFNYSSNENTKETNPMNKQRKFIFSEDAITVRAMTPNLGLERHLEEWLRSFILAVISNSPSESIRACSSLATSYYPLALKLFNAAFLSCWLEISEKGKRQITNSFNDLLHAADNYENVAHEIIKVIFFMYKTETPINIPLNDIVEVSIKFGGVPLALKLQEKIIGNEPENIDAKSKLIDIYLKLGNWPNAIGIWKKIQENSNHIEKAETLSKLKMWDQVHPIFEDIFNKTHNFQAFFGLAQSLSAMAMWPKLVSYIDYFQLLTTHQKKTVSVYFAEASMHLSNWDLLDDVLKYSPEDSLRCITLMAINSLHKQNFAKAEEYIENGFSLIASRPMSFFSESQEIQRETMFQCQELIEILEMKEWLLDHNKKEIEEVWIERLQTSPRDFDVWFGILANRASLVEICDDNLIKFFELRSVTLDTKIHINAFDMLFPNFNVNTAPDLHKVCYAVAHWNVGEKERAIAEMAHLTTTVSGDLLRRCNLLYVNWLLEKSDSYESLQKAYKHLSDNTLSLILPFSRPNDESFDDSPQSYNNLNLTYMSESNLVYQIRRKKSFAGETYALPSLIYKELTTNTLNIEILRRWSEINISLLNFDKEHLTHYVTNAIDALTKCATLSPSFPDVVQLLNLFFEYADQKVVFNSTAHKCIEKLHPKLMLQASPQLLIQLSNPCKNVAEFVHDIIIKLLLEHYHQLIFSVIVLIKSSNVKLAQASQMVLNKFMHMLPDVYNEVFLIRKTMLRVAITWYEKTMKMILDACDYYKNHQYDQVKIILKYINSLNSPDKAKCKMHKQFQKQFAHNFSALDTLLKIYNPENTSCMHQVCAWCNTMEELLNEELKRIKMIQLSSISPELGEKTNFLLAVPGTYKPESKLIRIKYFVGQFSVYMTKQQPKDVIIRGEDGNFYQYLLKGHEDLRLDERIMQFFRLVNSLLRKETCFNSNIIQTISVIPLSVAHGLVQWVPGTQTLRNIIEKYRKNHKIKPLLEYSLTDYYSDENYDYLLPIMKTQILEKIFKQVSDNDVADSFWLAAPSPELWFKQINTFSISTAITSVVGYVIGLGDRHPSNLLLDISTGKVVHIDFGDCFERAANRKFLPEVVPFRLTRMMVKAMGPVGVDGIFRTSFINMMSLLRDNSRVLEMVLSIFVQEPLVDSSGNESKNKKFLSKIPPGSIFDQSKHFVTIGSEFKAAAKNSVEMRKRVSQRLNGTDTCPNHPLSVEEQSARLIEMATSTYQLSKMYSGWCPFW